MLKYNTLFRFLTLLTVSLAGCTLTTTNVEPELPALPVNQSGSVVYHLNGVSVVAHNYSDFATQLLLPFLSAFGVGLPVRANLSAAGVLSVSCEDAQNVVRPGFKLNRLGWQLPQFHGVGTYAPKPVISAFQQATRDAADETWDYGPIQRLGTSNLAEVIVTDWNPVTQRIQGTFSFNFDAAGPAPAALIRDGQFDIILVP